MSGSFGKSDSESGNQASSSQNVWGPQGGALQNLYSSLGGLFNQSNNQMQGQIPGAVQQQQGVFNAANPAWQNQMQGGAYSGMDLQGAYRDALQGGGNEQFMNQSIMGGQGNNYVDAMRGQMQDDSSSRLGRSLSMNDARASSYGQSGSSRHGLTESRLNQDSNDRLADQQTKLGYDTFDKDMDRKMGIAQRADQFDMGRLNNVSEMMQGQQGAMQGGMNFGQNMQNLGMGQFAPSMAPWSAAGQYSSGLGQPTVLGQGQAGSSSNSKGLGFGGGK